MKTRLTLLAMALLTLTVFSARADETITVTATNDDISTNLDLKAVATLFGDVKTLEEFEQRLNDGENRISNLDLNADGYVDYLRVLESVENDIHAIIIQAVLAKDIYQDVATIYVEKDKENEEVTVQVIGDEYIYGANYIIEPVYIIRPHLYDWFWCPTWTCWYSRWYWDFYPSYWNPYTSWLALEYCRHIHTWHYHHAYCSYRYPHAPRPFFANYHRNYSRHDYALAHPQESFVNRNTGLTNAREIQTNRSTRDVNSTRGVNTVNGGSAAGNIDRTYGSSNIRAAGSTRVNSSSTAARTNVNGSSRTVSSTATAASTRNSSSSRVASTATTRTGAETSTRTGNSSTGRSASVTTTTRSTTPSTRSASSTVSRATTPTTTRSASSTSSRSSYSGTTSRSSSSYSGTSSRSSSSYSGSSSRSSSSYSGSSSRSSGSYSGGSSSRSSGSYSGGGSSRSGGSYSGSSSRSGGSSRR